MRMGGVCCLALVEGDLHGSAGVELAGLPWHRGCGCLWPEIRVVHKAAIGGEAVTDLTTHHRVEQFVVLAVGSQRHLVADGHIQANSTASVGIADAVEHVGGE